MSAARPGQFTAGAEPVLAIGYRDWCAVRSVWMIWCREKPLTLESNSDFCPEIRKPVTILTERVESPVEMS
jgi:hypothetical protein